MDLVLAVDEVHQPEGDCRLGSTRGIATTEGHAKSTISLIGIAGVGGRQQQPNTLIDLQGRPACRTPGSHPLHLRQALINRQLHAERYGSVTAGRQASRWLQRQVRTVSNLNSRRAELCTGLKAAGLQKKPIISPFELIFCWSQASVLHLPATPG